MPLKLRWEWLCVCVIGMQAKLALPHSVSCIFISSRLTLMSTFVLMRPSPPKLLPYIVKPVAYSCFYSALSLLHHTLSHIYLNKCFFVFCFLFPASCVEVTHNSAWGFSCLCNYTAWLWSCRLRSVLEASIVLFVIKNVFNFLHGADACGGELQITLCICVIVWDLWRSVRHIQLNGIYK